MAPSFTAYPSVSLVRREDYADTDRICDVFARRLVVAGPAVKCAIDAVELAGGVKLRFSSRIDELAEEIALTHKFVFVDRNETRERLHLLTPEAPEATSELLVLFDGERDRDYCHACVYDGSNRLLAVHVVVFDRQGRITQYPFTEQFVSPLRLADVRLAEVTDERGRRVLRFAVRLAGLEERRQVSIAWEAIGVTHKNDLVCTPDRPEAVFDMDLDDNHRLAAGDWVIIAVDENERFLAQTMVTLVAREAGSWSC